MDSCALNEFFGFGVKSDHLEYIFSEEDQVAGKVGQETNLRKHSFVLADGLFVATFEEEHLIWENSEERVFWGLGGGTGAEMTSIGLGGVVAALV